jgi:hypothetical protein
MPDAKAKDGQPVKGGTEPEVDVVAKDDPRLAQRDDGNKTELAGGNELINDLRNKPLSGGSELLNEGGTELVNEKIA